MFNFWVWWVWVEWLSLVESVDLLSQYIFIYIESSNLSSTVFFFDFFILIKQSFGGIGRHDGLKIHCFKRRIGSSPIMCMLFFFM